MAYEREFDFSENDFVIIKTRIKDIAGIHLSDRKKDMVYSRLARRLRSLNLKRIADYLKLIDDDEQELINFVNSLTTNLTSFFREKHHFEYLADPIVPELVRLNRHDKKIRIWISASSTGEEAFSTAFTLCESIQDWRNWDIKILATDLDSNVIRDSKTGIYPKSRIEGLDEKLVQKYFLNGSGKNRDFCRVKPEILSLISFKEFNLIAPEWRLKKQFDVVFCRNVLIYFDKETQQQVLRSILKVLKNEGHLFLGHSESIGDLKNQTTHLGKTWFRNIPDTQSSSKVSLCG
ncbi:MAG TPA: protein-glutamate O-methyltransferase CheR [Aeromonadales bacterium]|nr:protein-glutamate O-methyltransferase CheR [Aeromonadales bacterium]